MAADRVGWPEVGELIMIDIDTSGSADGAAVVQRVMVVDDESALRVITGRLLELLGRDAVVAADADEARQQLDHADAAGSRIQAVILDATLRGSEQLYAELNGAGRGIPVVLASGCVSQEIQDRFPAHPEDRALQKPYGLEELREVLDHLSRRG